MTEKNDYAELLSLLDSLCNDQMAPEQLSRLQDLLRDKSEAQQTYLAYLDMHLGLKHVVAVELGNESSINKRPDETATPPIRVRNPLTFGRVLAASLLAVAGVIGISLEMTQTVPLPQGAATVTSISGSVRVEDTQGKTHTARVGMDVFAGDRVETNGSGALAVLVYVDGTQLALVNDSSVTFVAGKRKSVMLQRGFVSAQVAAQPVGRPMFLTTPSAKIEILGTKFAIAATTDGTELNVSEGRVRLTRVLDGQTVEVAQGQGVNTNGEVALAVHESDGPNDDWNVDFEQGIPKGWTGTLVTTDLPKDSRGAVQAIASQESEPAVYVIASRDEWVEGMFVVHDDSQLHITMKMEHPDWLNVFLMTRGSDATNPTWAMHNFNEVPFWPPKSGQWRTVTIPLSKFRRKRDDVFHNDPPVVGEVAYSLSISATEPDRGLVVDRIWVTRGGSGNVETKP